MRKFTAFLVCMLMLKTISAQTDTDGLFMGKNNFCGGFLGTYSSWNNYWEGTLYRNNENLGTVSSNSVMFMGNYGITKRLNIIATLPWIQNQASSGTLLQQQGIQDLSLFLKSEIFAADINGFLPSFVVIAGGSIPLTNYVADFMPMSIGTQSKNAIARAMFDIQKGNWFFTSSVYGMLRSDVTIDRTAYYTTELIYSNKVSMPAVTGYNVRIGWREKIDTYAELVLDGMNTMGGFDIRRDDMPFLSNDMEAIRVGFNGKYLLPGMRGLSVMGAFQQVLSGRNTGKSTAYTLGLVYQLNLKNQSKQP